jgi:hypothetical protein
MTRSNVFRLGVSLGVALFGAGGAPADRAPGPDSFYPLEEGQTYRNRMGAAGNAKISLEPFTLQGNGSVASRPLPCRAEEAHHTAMRRDTPQGAFCPTRRPSYQVSGAP